MVKHNQNNPARRGAGEGSPTGGGGGMLPVVTMIALGVLLVISLMNLMETRRQRDAFNERVTLLEGQITVLGTKVDAVAAKTAAPPARPQGPDPNRVYAVKTDGGPAKGPKSAPVTIALFSDFQ